MEEAPTKEALEDAEGRETFRDEAPLEERNESDSAESRLTDREIYKSQVSERRYSRTVDYERASKQTPKKSSARKQGLERVVADSNVEKELGIGPSELLSSNLAQRIRFFIANRADESNSSEKKREDLWDTHDGIQYIPFSQNPETGEFYFSVEIKAQTYRDPAARGKLAFHGETARVGENNPLEVAVRGIIEENPKSHRILLDAWKENGQVYDTVKRHIDGVPSETTVILFKVPWESWGEYTSDRNPEAPKVIMNLDEISKTKRTDWAFNNYDLLKGVIGNLHNFQAAKNSGKVSHFAPMVYSDSIMQKHGDLSTQILNSSPHKVQFQISSSVYNRN